MGTLNQTANALGRNDDRPNIDLAERLAAAQDHAGINEIAGGLRMDARTAGDCIKVLYEIGYRDPALIAPYTEAFLDLLSGKNNRLVWGAMAALARVTALRPRLVWDRLDTVLEAYRNGSVITVDNAISVFAALCAAGAAYAERVMPVLTEHFQTCRAKEIPQHFERVSACLPKDAYKPVTAVILRRMEELSPPQRQRVERILKKPGA